MEEQETYSKICFPHFQFVWDVWNVWMKSRVYAICWKKDFPLWMALLLHIHTYCVHLQAKIISPPSRVHAYCLAYSSALKMKAVHSFRTLVNFTRQDWVAVHVEPSYDIHNTNTERNVHIH
jgi:hypothetical protein